ncbi:hypothetical protein UA32_16175 [Photobacterium angustum]|nr:DUF2271 domain-containing protein [Photobacterium angustum]KJG36543.1 hypothetical protein UA32_16175 [Photobacterium angustum]
MLIHYYIKIIVLSFLVISPFSYAHTIPNNSMLEIELTLPEIKTGMYARPYVAIWVEDENHQPIKTLQLWVGKDDWLKDLRSWWRKIGRYDRDRVDAVTSATRPAGKYHFLWDGINDNGEKIEQGTYTLYVEVVREHGGRDFFGQNLELDESSFSHVLKAKHEIGKIKIDYKVE